jgi:hypothetical protein
MCTKKSCKSLNFVMKAWNLYKFLEESTSISTSTMDPICSLYNSQCLLIVQFPLLKIAIAICSCWFFFLAIYNPKTNQPIGHHHENSKYNSTNKHYKIDYLCRNPPHCQCSYQDAIIAPNRMTWWRGPPPLHPTHVPPQIHLQHSPSLSLFHYPSLVNQVALNTLSNLKW